MERDGRLHRKKRQKVLASALLPILRAMPKLARFQLKGMNVARIATIGKEMITVRIIINFDRRWISALQLASLGS